MLAVQLNCWACIKFWISHSEASTYFKAFLHLGSKFFILVWAEIKILIINTEVSEEIAGMRADAV